MQGHLHAIFAFDVYWVYIDVRSCVQELVMDFVTARELRAESARVWEKDAATGYQTGLGQDDHGRDRL